MKLHSSQIFQNIWLPVLSCSPMYRVCSYRLPYISSTALGRWEAIAFVDDSTRRQTK
ncbi:hypothetical protein SODALDRAFT_331679 [Sodiomyces alkalinus F11]|uniref:Uncharacterized protein n=1 Tax=Sodiomyces alkalinus (strain CBS 110278 / VKM F-3762 / F11) TaxID=1314773 RepID=A0A3N2PYH0_SODAK|nr:hypothetical protein SODALDRAFT_331679 [Sodiomyces alkalinus F11]ROT39560.1 hypothetical protein SODALDRAFT_331679 [Sodiomyces alkalinus F11]